MEEGESAEAVGLEWQCGENTDLARKFANPSDVHDARLEIIIL